MENRIEFVNISKSFGSTKALNDISFSVKEGEIIALLGENGSGKTTLMNVLSGIYAPDAGVIYVDGRQVKITSPRDAFKYRIGMVHQHFKLIDVLSAVENTVLGLSKADYAFFRSEALESELEKFKKIEEKLVFGSDKGVRVPPYIVRRMKEIDKVSAKAGQPLHFLSFIKTYSKENLDAFMKEYKNYRRLMKSTKSFDLKESSIRIGRLCKKYGFNVDPQKKAHDMSVSEKQTLEIVKVLYRGADTLILDEPTAVLTPQETEKLFDVLRAMKEGGKTVIIITHKLNEVLEISDRVVILRKGEFIGDIVTKEANEQILTEMMVGKKVKLNIKRDAPLNDHVVLSVNNLTVKDKFGIAKVDNASFNLYSGEVLGIAGISGCGQKELLEAIAGLQPTSKESSILFTKDKGGESKEIIGLNPRDIHHLGISLSFVPEDRLGMGLVGNMGMTENMMLKNYQEGKPIFVTKKPSKKLATNIKNELEVVTPTIETPVRLLSGGNVQKVLVGREISNAPSVLMTAYAVRGLDINTSYTIYNLLNEQKKKGVGVIYVGEDLDVLLGLADRILVLCGGKVNGILDARKTSKEEIGLYMTKIMNDEKKVNLSKEGK